MQTKQHGCAHEQVVGKKTDHTNSHHTQHRNSTLNTSCFKCVTNLASEFKTNGVNFLFVLW